MLRLDDLRMIGDRVLVDPDPKHETSQGGIVVPETVLAGNPNYYNMTGVVLQLGNGVMRHTFQCINCLALTPQDEGPCPGCHQPLGNKNTRLFEADTERYQFDVKVGDRVLFNRFAGKQVEINLDPANFAALMQSEHLLPQTKRMLIMHESEILGTVEGEHRIEPGYQAPKWGKVADGLTI